MPKDYYTGCAYCVRKSSNPFTEEISSRQRDEGVHSTLRKQYWGSFSS